MAAEKKFTRINAFTEAFNKFKEKGEFTLDDLAKEIDKVFVKKGKGKANFSLSREEARKGLQYVEALGVKIKQEVIHKITVEEAE